MSSRKTSRALHDIEELIREQNALSSIDLIYFLLFPITLFLFTQLSSSNATQPWFAFIVNFFMAGLISLPIGIYAKMVDSITERIRAWAAYFATAVGNAMLWLGMRKDFPSLFPVPMRFSLTLVLDWVFSLGFFFFWSLICYVAMSWVFSVFKRRLPSRRRELNRASSMFPMANVLVGPKGRRERVLVALFALLLMTLAVLIHSIWPT
ncbi:MAG: hypothetical protein ABSF63_03550 [Candidatus Bathyarchaeia archaeon]|jgi:hypothetical protein